MDSEIKELRRVIWRAYAKARDVWGRIDGKSGEGVVTVTFPAIWDCQTEEQFVEAAPASIMVYSYALGPSRGHYFFKSDRDYKAKFAPEYYAKDPVARATKVVEGWARDRKPVSDDPL